MAFRVTLDGAMKGIKFATKDEAKDALWDFYKDKMDRAAFDTMIEQHIEEA